MSTLSDNVVCLPNARSVQHFHYPVTQAGEFTDRPMLAFSPEEQSAGREAFRKQELAAAVSAAREQGTREAEAQAASATAQAIEQERMAVAAALKDFDRQRGEYFRQVELEAVRLALSIARKILHREAQMDPLLLSGIVRVALDQVQAGTRITLRVPPDSVPGWKHFCETQLEDGNSVEVRPDDALKMHECVLETELGRTEISLDAQLAEIENGFFDCRRQPEPKDL